MTAEIASVIADGAFYYLDAPVKRMGAMDVPIPFSPALEDLTVPTPESVVEMAKSLCNKTDCSNVQAVQVVQTVEIPLTA